jgi:UDP-N-acetylmuramyl tripeptide synthase
LGIDLPAIKKGLEGFSASFGRMETILVGNKRVVFALVKNSAAATK